jgi:hypothetical protein
VRWIAVACVSIPAILVGLFYLQGELRRSPSAVGALRALPTQAIDAEASEYCRDTDRDALALVLVTDTNPYHIARAYGSRRGYGDMGRYVQLYWGCLYGLGIPAGPPAKFLAPQW